MLRTSFPDIRFSPVYQSAPLEMKDQPAFLNAAASFETKLTSEKVGVKLKTIEKKLKKNTPVRFGPRTIDLDLLLYGNNIGLEDELRVPHPRMHTRRFVLEPLIELGAGDLMHPRFDRKLKEFLKDVKGQECEKTKLKPL